MKRIALLSVVSIIVLAVCLPAAAQESPDTPAAQAANAAPEIAGPPETPAPEPSPPAEVAPQAPADPAETPAQTESTPAPVENPPHPDPAPVSAPEPQPAPQSQPAPPASPAPEVPTAPPAPESPGSGIPPAEDAVEPAEIPGLLIVPEMLAAHPDLIPVDVRSAEIYAAGHLAGAVSLPAESLSEERGGVRNLLKPVDQLAVLLAERGMTTDRRYVLYGGNRNVKEVRAATRVLWVLEYLSFREVYVLDGGFVRWTAEGRPVESGAYTPAPIRAESVKLAIRPEVIARRAEVIDMVGSGKGKLVDTRMPGYYAGTEKAEFVTRAGHIPTAVNIPADPMLTGPDFRFRPLEEIRAEFTTGSDDPLERIVVYCNSGSTASLGYFLFRMLGKENVAVYDGSMAEWSRNPALSVVTEPAAGELPAPSAPGAQESVPPSLAPVPEAHPQMPAPDADAAPAASPAETASPPAEPPASAPAESASAVPAAQPEAEPVPTESSAEPAPTPSEPETSASPAATDAEASPSESGVATAEQVATTASEDPVVKPETPETPSEPAP